MWEQGWGLAAIIESIATRSDNETARLTRAWLGRSWPGEVTDRREPGAIDWLRRWGPQGPAPVPPVCSCRAGRCAVCN